MSFAMRAKRPAAQKVTPCAVRSVLEQLPDEEAAALRRMLADDVKDRSHTSLAADFDDEGYPVSDSTIGKHRRRECSCRTLVKA